MSRHLQGILAGIAVAGVLAASGLTARACVAQRKAADLDLEAAAFERGLTFGLDLASRLEPSPTDCVAEAPLPTELSALAACRASFDDYRRTEAANRTNARDLGLNEGLRLGREDWQAQPWECRAGLSELATRIR